ncbi:DUF4268 domain-containing protein [Candidatus Poribacteria bacterium]|nr:DUF4268 domain-containing protein [Candidatus Poribacteria bacterium]
MFGETSFCGCEFGVIGFDEGVGRTFKRHIWLVAAITPCKGWISAKVRFSEYVPIELFDMLTKDIEQIKSCFDTPNQVDWDKPGPGPKRVGFFRSKIDFDDKSSWEELFEWLCVNLEKLEQVFMNFLALYFYDTVK